MAIEYDTFCVCYIIYTLCIIHMHAKSKQVEKKIRKENANQMLAHYSSK